MTSRTTLIAVGACFLGFVAGFMFANSLNRSELAMKSSVDTAAQPTDAPASQPGGAVLTPDEIKAKVAAADENPTDFQFQKGLGMSLYRYASLKQDASILPDAIRIMQRALDLDPADRDLVIGLGNAHFDVGYFNKDNNAFQVSREFYNKALARVPSDVDVRTDLALTYFLQEPPDLKTAVAEFEKGLEINPKHERSLQFLTRTYIKQNETAKASETLDRLKATNPSNSAISELMTLMAGGPSATQ